jgi:hypothetical protein
MKKRKKYLANSEVCLFLCLLNKRLSYGGKKVGQAFQPDGALASGFPAEVRLESLTYVMSFPPGVILINEVAFSVLPKTPASAFCDESPGYSILR